MTNQSMTVAPLEVRKVFCRQMSRSLAFYRALLMAMAGGVRPNHMDLSETGTHGTRRRHVMTVELYGGVSCVLDLEEGTGPTSYASNDPDDDGIPASALRLPSADTSYPLWLLETFRTKDDPGPRTALDGTIFDPDGNRICLHRRVLRTRCHNAAKTALFYEAITPRRTHIKGFAHPGLVLEGSTWLEFHSDPRGRDGKGELDGLTLKVLGTLSDLRDRLNERGFEAASILKENINPGVDRPTVLLVDPDGRLVLVSAEREQA